MRSQPKTFRRRSFNLLLGLCLLGTAARGQNLRMLIGQPYIPSNPFIVHVRVNQTPRYVTCDLSITITHAISPTTVFPHFAQIPFFLLGDFGQVTIPVVVQHSGLVYTLLGVPGSSVLPGDPPLSYLQVPYVAGNSSRMGLGYTLTFTADSRAGVIPASSITASVIFDLSAYPGSGVGPGNGTLDFDGDGKSDFNVWRPSEGAWYQIPSHDPDHPDAQLWGQLGDIPVPGDYDGDGKTDFAIWRPLTGAWHVIPSSIPIFGTFGQAWGSASAGETPVPGDYDGDGKNDFAVWRADGRWAIILSRNSAVAVRNWGTSGDIPVPGDYDGDGKADLAVWRPSDGVWYIIVSSDPDHPVLQQWGTANDVPMPGDYDGDGRTDFAVWRPSNGTWYVIPSGLPNSPLLQQWGTAWDIPVYGDFDGDHKTDFAIWRPSDGVWYIIPSSNPAVPILRQWGTAGDHPN